MLSLIVTGTPSSSPSGLPSFHRRALSSAARIAPVSSSVTIALRRGLTLRICASVAAITSFADSPPAYAAQSSRAVSDHNGRSLAGIVSGKLGIGRPVEEPRAGDVFASGRHIRLLIALAAGFKRQFQLNPARIVDKQLP